MSRRNKKNEKPVTVHPPIMDLLVAEHKVQCYSGNFSEEESDLLSMRATFNFGTLDLTLYIFSRDDSDWKLSSIAGLYNFHRISILQSEFNEMRTSSLRKEKVFQLSIIRIGRHVLMKKFTIKVTYKLQANSTIFNKKFTFEVPYFQRDTRLQFKFLDQFFADDKIKALYESNFEIYPEMLEELQELAREIKNFQRNRSSGDPMQMVKYAMNIEDLSSQDELKEFTLKNVEIREIDGMYGFSANRGQLPHGFEEMSICITSMKDKEGDSSSKKDSKDSKEGFFYAQIDKYNNNTICFEKKSPPQPSTEKLYQVQFIPNRISFRARLQAIDSLVKNSLGPFFDDFEVAPEYTKTRSFEKITDFEWFNKKIADNEEQKKAIKNIVNCTAFPFPYIVFGPPGTGKTSCLVECIAQIVTEKERSKILVTAQSNSACDEIGERLLKYVSRNKIFRFYSPSLLNPNASDVSEMLRETSNIRGKENQMPTKEEFFSFNVVIVTLMTCSRLVQLSGVEISRHFDYIFIDEAGAATQPETYVPIVGLGTDYREITSNIVLFGDHKQLGPVILNPVAEGLGLGESLMERIMTKRRYLMDPVDKSFDEKYVTQLLDNFRSNKAILQFSNVLFYGSKLRAKVSEPDKSLGMRWNYLTNHKFPLVFHCTKTPSEIMRNGTSSFNEGEVKIVRFYVNSLLNCGIDGEKILEDDIGIVSPYKAQLNRLRDEFRRENNLEIGTTEYYQGREKKIIIVSTVKSGDTVGFLKSEKRLNVCFTRAKSLLIVIGNADTLKQNSMWKSFIQFCYTNGGCHGEKFNLASLTNEEENLQDELNSVFNETSNDFQAERTTSDKYKEEFKNRMKDRRHGINVNQKKVLK